MKVLVHLVPRFGAEKALDDRVREIAADLRARFSAEALRVNTLVRVDDDVFGRGTRIRGTLEIEAHPGCDVPAAMLADLTSQLDDASHLDLSSLLIGEDQVFIEPPRSPLRMQYLMRRKVGLTHEAYLAHYRDVHSGFGMRTPGIAGYVQFHVDAKATRRVAAQFGFGGFGIDSVSQLYLDRVETFLEAVSTSPVGREAIADEKTFVDRKNSVDFVSRVEWQV